MGRRCTECGNKIAWSELAFAIKTSEGRFHERCLNQRYARRIWRAGEKPGPERKI